MSFLSPFRKQLTDEELAVEFHAMIDRKQKFVQSYFPMANHVTVNVFPGEPVLWSISIYNGEYPFTPDNYLCTSNGSHFTFEAAFQKLCDSYKERVEIAIKMIQGQIDSNSAMLKKFTEFQQAQKAEK